MRKLLLALAFALTLAPALAQAPGPIPALPDSERRTQYSATAQTGPFNVGFQLYGDDGDPQNWVQVYVNGIQTTAWTMTSPSGSISTIARPITDAQITFTAAQTGTVQIVGARRPRRLAQFAENRGVAAHDHNQALNDIEAQLREHWDEQTRTIQGVPGEVFPVLPPAANRLGAFLCFDGVAGLPTTCTGGPAGTALVAGAGITLTPAGGNTTISSQFTSAMFDALFGTTQDTMLVRGASLWTAMTGAALPTNYATNPAANGCSSGCALDLWYPRPPVGHSAYEQQLYFNYGTAEFSYWGFGGLGNVIVVNHTGYQAFLGGSRTSNLPTPVPSSYVGQTAGGYFIGENDSGVCPACTAWGAYIEGRASNLREAQAAEFDVENSSGSDARITDPYNTFGTSSTGPLAIGISIVNGGSKIPIAPLDVSTGILITGNVGGTACSGAPCAFKSGIVIDNTAIHSVSGHKEAMKLPQANEITWYSAAGPGTNVGRLTSPDGIGLTWVSGSFSSRSMVSTGSAPTGTGACAISSQTGGNTAGTFKTVTGCSATAITLTFADTAPNGWACQVSDTTTTTDTIIQNAYTQTTATFVATTASNDVMVFQCKAF